MPTIWIEPALAMKVGNHPIYHAYDNDEADKLSLHCFTTDVSEIEDYEFNVRSLPVPLGVAPDNYKLIIEAALSDGLIFLPNDEKHEALPSKVPATLRSDDCAKELTFCIHEWLERATDKDIFALCNEGWSNSTAADSVVEWYKDHSYPVACLFYYLETEPLDEDVAGYQFSIDEELALSYLEENNPDSYWSAMCMLGKAIKVSGVVAEVLKIEKEVETHIEIDGSESAQITDSVDGTLSSLLDFVNNGDLQERAESALRDCAYEVGICQGNHGWEAIETASVDVSTTICPYSPSAFLSDKTA